MRARLGDNCTPPMLKSGEAIAIGTHSISLEGDTLFVVQNGTFHLDDAQKTHDLVEKVLYSVGRVFVLVDQSQAGSTSSEARRYIADWNKKHKVSGAAIFGGGPIARTASALAVSVIQFLRKEPLPVAFFATEKEARAWVVKLRGLLETKKA